MYDLLYMLRLRGFGMFFSLSLPCSLDFFIHFFRVFLRNIQLFLFSLTFHCIRNKVWSTIFTRQQQKNVEHFKERYSIKSKKKSRKTSESCKIRTWNYFKGKVYVIKQEEKLNFSSAREDIYFLALIKLRQSKLLNDFVRFATNVMLSSLSSGCKPCEIQFKSIGTN